MTKFKVGQKVRCVINTGGEAAGSSWELGRVFTITKIDENKSCPNATAYYDFYDRLVFEDHLEAVAKTIEDVDYPDIIEVRGGKHKVLARINDLVFMSYEYDFNSSFSSYTISELKENGYKIVQEEVEEDQDVEDAIKLLEEKGKLKDGKILEA